jgi:hypothetical protein
MNVMYASNAGAIAGQDERYLYFSFSNPKKTVRPEYVEGLTVRNKYKINFLIKIRQIKNFIKVITLNQFAKSLHQLRQFYLF